MTEEEEVKNFKEACRPLIKWLCENCAPHVTVIVEPNGAELVEGLCSVTVEEFIND